MCCIHSFSFLVLIANCNSIAIKWCMPCDAHTPSVARSIKTICLDFQSPAIKCIYLLGIYCRLHCVARFAEVEMINRSFCAFVIAVACSKQSKMNRKIKQPSNGQRLDLGSMISSRKTRNHRSHNVSPMGNFRFPFT